MLIPENYYVLANKITKMRYLGSKETLIEPIKKLLLSKDLMDKGYTLLDAFCGMGAVSNAFKGNFNIIANDILHSCITYTESRLLCGLCDFKDLGFNPFEYLNNNDEIINGFIFKNYSPGGSSRMYFSKKNAGRIDYFRKTIEHWRINNKITNNEYIYLLGCLLEAVSLVSNTAGVYGAFLKHWDGRALKDIIISPLGGTISNKIDYKVYNSRIEDIVKNVDCDVIYLDPPYTQNQYGTQYHLLETIVLGDEPSVSEVTGSRPTTPMRSDWSKMYLSHIHFDFIIANTKAKHIVFSYNNDGFMSKDYIESILKRYGKEDTYQCIAIDYKKYNNIKCRGRAGHVEYLFYIEKRDKEDVIIESPLNYQGNKSKIVPIIKRNLPSNINTFIDAFGGGFNVGINIDAKNIIYNDINHYVKGLIASFGELDTLSYLQFIEKTKKKFGLSTEDKEAYLTLRKTYNSLKFEERDPRLFYTMIMYGFQQQIRFNSAHEFNNPFGTRYFNDKVLAKFISFSREQKTKNITYVSCDYKDLEEYINQDTVIYLDPPYLNALGSYNDGKRGFNGWNIIDEQLLCKYLESLSERAVRFLLSYIASDSILDWADQRNFQIININQQGRYHNRPEVLIKNY